MSALSVGPNMALQFSACALKDVERCQVFASMYIKCSKLSLPSSTGQFRAQVPHKGFLVLSQLHLADLALSEFLRPIRTK